MRTPNRRRAKKFWLALSRHLATIPLKGTFKTELDLERFLRKAVKRFASTKLGLATPDAASAVYSHGETSPEKKAWSQSKALQNVVVYGCANSSDIFITHQKMGSIYIEVKLSKARGKSATSLPGDMQRSIGQSVIASLRHPAVICFIGILGKLRSVPQDLGKDLKRTLLQKHRIALIVRPFGSSVNLATITAS
jgi:hypothetical protein